MQDWQQTLAPVCQKALTLARQTIETRGGCAVTVEDFLLELLALDTRLGPLFKRWGVDFDELVRTVQCEQPLVPVPIADQSLSAQMVDWLSLARERHGSDWLTAGQLLEVLAHQAERFQHKAYQAVLELVPRHAWQTLELAGTGLMPPLQAITRRGEPRRMVRPLEPLAPGQSVMCASVMDQLRQALATVRPRTPSLLWLRADSPRRERECLRHLAALDRLVDPGEAEPAWFEVDTAHLAGRDCPLSGLKDHLGRQHAGARVVLQGCTPAMLVLLVEKSGVLAWHAWLRGGDFRLILTSNSARPGMSSHDWLAEHLGIRVDRLDLPLPNLQETLMLLRLEQPRIERQWHLEIADTALEAAALLARLEQQASGQESVADQARPEAALDLLHHAAASKRAEMEAGSRDLLALQARYADLQRRRLTCQARGGSGLAAIEKALADVSLELAAEEAHWNERTGRHARLLVREDILAQAAREREIPVCWPGELEQEGGPAPDIASYRPGNR